MVPVRKEGWYLCCIVPQEKQDQRPEVPCRLVSRNWLNACTCMVLGGLMSGWELVGSDSSGVLFLYHSPGRTQMPCFPDRWI